MTLMVCLLKCDRYDWWDSDGLSGACREGMEGVFGRITGRVHPAARDLSAVGRSRPGRRHGDAAAGAQSADRDRTTAGSGRRSLQLALTGSC
jgi:hypothetical protein